MFHLFTIDGKKLDLSLENIHQNQGINRINKNYRTRKDIAVDIHGAEGSPDREGGGTHYGREAYRKAVRMENVEEHVYHASEIMSSPVVAVDSRITAAEAWKKFNENDYRHMPVVSGEGAIIGILSERDLLKKLILRGGKAEDAVDITVRDLMSSDVIATNPQTDIRRVARAMLEHHVGLMPIIDEKGGLAGVVTRSDILHAIIHHPGFSLWA